MTWATGGYLTKNERLKIKRRTHTRYDGYENVPLQNEESYSALSTLPDRFPQLRAPYSENDVIKSLLLLALIDEKCEYVENNSVKRRKLFNSLRQSLSSTGIVDTALSLAELDEILRSVRKGFSEMMINAQLDLQRLPHAEFPANFLHNLSMAPILRPFSSDCSYVAAGDIPHRSRYLEEFKELEVIGQGGFGVVLKAKKLVDNCIYAVKKISFLYRNRSSLEKVAREVEVLAKLNHPNIVTYKTAWIEYELQNSGEFPTLSSTNSTMTDVELSTVIRNKQGSESENDSIQFTDESVGQNRKDDRKFLFPVVSMEHNQSSRNVSSTSLTYLQNSINSSSPHIDFELAETSITNSYTAVSIKEITNSSEIIKEDSSSSIEDKLCSKEDSSVQFEDTCDMYNYDDIPSTSLSRQRHCSGTTCKSHSDSEIDDVFTVQRKKISTVNDFKNLPLARCGSFDTTCKLLPLFQTTCVENNFPVPFSSWRLKGTLYIQMELCAESLRDWLDERDSREPLSQEDIFDRVSDKQVMSIFRQVLKGVEHIHSLGLIHRDLKPQNIFFDYTHSKVKIGDFGLAACYCDPDMGCVLCTENSNHTVGVGTTPYAALEQRCGQIYDSMADMYSLGVILVELLHPFGTKMERAECLQKLCDGVVPVEIKKKWPDKAPVMESLLNKDPKLRPSATEVLNSSLFLNKTQVIESLQKENSELKQELKIKNKSIEEKDNEIAKLKKMLEVMKIITKTEK